jgi:DNA-binding FrmR family transcriptional regulator
VNTTPAHARHHRQLPRLRRISGQVQGLERMVEDERYCVDILTQVRAVRAALKRVEDALVREHVEHCVKEALKRGDKSATERKVEELLDVLARFSG